MQVKTPPLEKYALFFEELASLYAAMDRRYDEVASQYGFKCNGCTDNCCLTRFYHHTYIEYLYLLNGFSRLGVALQKKIKTNAEKANQQVGEADAKGQTPRIMCPLNIGGTCILYPYRPMICRLHGIAHEFTPPGQKTVMGSGCPEFARRYGDRGYITFDRTPFYLQMAALEQRFKQQFGLTKKFKKTVCEMLVPDCSKTPEGNVYEIH